MDDPTTMAWAHPYILSLRTPLIVGATSFYAGAVIWLHAWRQR